jgi:hypothetical protein
MDDLEYAQELRAVRERLAQLERRILAEDGRSQLNRALRRPRRGDVGAALRELRAEAQAAQTEANARARLGETPEKIPQPTMNDALRRAAGRG